MSWLLWLCSISDCHYNINAIHLAFYCLLSESGKVQRMLTQQYTDIKAALAKLITSCHKLTLSLDGWTTKGLTYSYLGISVCFLIPYLHNRSCVTRWNSTHQMAQTEVAKDESRHQCCVEWVGYRHAVSEWVGTAGGNDQSVSSIFRPDWHTTIQFPFTVTCLAIPDGPGMSPSAVFKFNFIRTSIDACWLKISILVTSLPPVQQLQSITCSCLPARPHRRIRAADYQQPIEAASHQWGMHGV